MADHEIAPAANQPIDRDEIRWNNLVDGAGFSPAEADLIISGYDPDRIPYPKPHRPRPRHSHRGGRSYPEASDSELDPNWNVESAEVTAEERATSHVAALAALTQLQLESDQRFIDRLHDEERAASLRGETIHPGALWRARQEKRERRG